MMIIQTIIKDKIVNTPLDSALILHRIGGVIIFCSIRFLLIKITKLKFYKIYKKPETKPKPDPTDQFRFSSIILK